MDFTAQNLGYSKFKSYSYSCITFIWSQSPVVFYYYLFIIIFCISLPRMNGIGNIFANFSMFSFDYYICEHYASL